MFFCISYPQFAEGKLGITYFKIMVCCLAEEILNAQKKEIMSLEEFWILCRYHIYHIGLVRFVLIILALLLVMLLCFRIKKQSWATRACGYIAGFFIIAILAILALVFKR